jgi:hypothetical protein
LYIENTPKNTLYENHDTKSFFINDIFYNEEYYKNISFEDLISVNGDFEKIIPFQFDRLDKYKKFAQNTFKEIENKIYSESKNKIFTGINEIVKHELKHLKENIASDYLKKESFKFKDYEIKIILTLDENRNTINSKGENRRNNTRYPITTKAYAIRDFYASSAGIFTNKKDSSAYREISYAFEQKKIEDCDIEKIIKNINNIFYNSFKNEKITKILDKFRNDKKNKKNTTIKIINKSLSKNEYNYKYIDYSDLYLLNILSNFFKLNKNDEAEHEDVFIYYEKTIKEEYDYSKDIILLKNINKIFIDEIKTIIKSIDIKNCIKNSNCEFEFLMQFLDIVFSKVCIRLLYIGSKKQNEIFARKTLKENFPKTNKFIKENIKKNMTLNYYAKTAGSRATALLNAEQLNTEEIKKTLRIDKNLKFNLNFCATPDQSDIEETINFYNKIEKSEPKGSAFFDASRKTSSLIAFSYLIFKNQTISEESLPEELFYSL